MGFGKKGILLACSMLLVGCSSRCEHVWKEASCTEPQICTLCEEIGEEELGHAWLEATCDRAKICVICGETTGRSLGHEYEGFKCTKGGKCIRCGGVEKVRGHRYGRASCLKPRTCSECGKESGNPLGHKVSEGKCVRCGKEVLEEVIKSRVGGNYV